MQTNHNLFFQQSSFNRAHAAKLTYSKGCGKIPTIFCVTGSSTHSISFCRFHIPGKYWGMHVDNRESLEKKLP